MYIKIPKMTALSVVVILSMLWTGCTITVNQPTGAAPPMAAEAPAIVPAEEMSTLAGTGPDFPMMPTSEWMTIENGQYQWYAFSYDFDEGYAPVEIRMYTEPKDGAILTVRNAEQAQLWREEGKHEHIGCCTVQDLGGDNETDYALWAGELGSSGRYYIVVEHAKNMPEMANYRFTVEGEGVSFPVGAAMPAGEVAAAPAMDMESTPPLSMPEPIKLAGLNGTGPDYALAPTAEWTEIGEGQYQWYAFSYDFDEGYAPVEIRMYTEPKDGAILTVRNVEQAQLWREEGKHEHIGCCTVQDMGGDNETDYALWSGKLYSSGIYYVVIEHAKGVSGPVYYMFTLEGEGVSH